MGLKDEELSWCIVKDKEAVSWDYKDEFDNNQRSINDNNDWNKLEVISLLENEFEQKYTFDFEEKSSIVIELLCPCCDRNNIYDKGDLLGKTKAIMEAADDEQMTKFAQFILEEWERMCKHE